MRIKECALVFLVFFVLFFALIGLASADNQCINDAQTIFKLESESNAHSALWNYSAYSIKVCYDSYFTNHSEDKGEDSHKCDAGYSNRLLSLSAEQNAHASFAGGQGYPINICHEGLKDCEIKSNLPNACPVNKSAIVFLSAETNAHVSRMFFSNYPYVICCAGKYGNSSGGGGGGEEELICADYKSMFDCNSASSRIAQNDPGCPADKKAIGACYCKWTAQNICAVAYNSTGPGGCRYTCSKSMTDYESAECTEGMKDVGIKASIIPIPPATSCNDPNTDCLDSTAKVPCGLELAELGFFGIWQFAAAIACIAFAYFLINIKRG